MINIMWHELLRLLRGYDLPTDSQEDIKEMEIWSSNIQDPQNINYNPFFIEIISNDM